MLKSNQNSKGSATDRGNYSYNTIDASSRAVQNNVLPIQKGPVNYSSSYNDNYLKPEGKAVTKVTRYDMINNNFIFPQDRFKGESNYSGTYKNNTDSRIKSEKVSYPENEMFPKGKFIGNSSYVDTYVNSQGMRSQIVKHQPEIVLGTSNYEAVSSYNAQYVKKDRVTSNERVSVPPNFILPKGNFAGSSTYGETYLQGAMQRTEQIKPPEGELKVGGKFEGNSSYAADYDERNRVNNVREKAHFIENDVLPRGDFKGNSTYQSNYLFNEKPTPSKMMKHQQELQVGGQFYGSSNYASNFDNKGSAVRQKIVNIPNNQVLPEGSFQDYTTYTGHYVPNPVQKNKLYRQEGELTVGEGVFNGQTSYESDYMQKQGEARQRTISYPSNDVLPKGNFVGNSTYEDNYIASKIERRQQYQPAINLQVGGKFQGNSSYTEHYDGGVTSAKYLTKLSNYDSNKHR